MAMKTLAGMLRTNREVTLTKIVLPEFARSKCIDGINAFVFDKPCQYDVILGRDFLNKAVPYKGQQLAIEEFLLLEDDKTDLEEEEFDSFVSEIREAKYEKITAEEIAARQHHLSPIQRELLAEALKKIP
eukprot:8752570-Ditylum_brightwellii.AAC.1